MDFLLEETRKEAAKVLRLGDQLASRDLRDLADELFLTAHQIERIIQRRMAANHKERDLIVSLWQEE